MRIAIVGGKLQGVEVHNSGNRSSVPIKTKKIESLFSQHSYEKNLKYAAMKLFCATIL